MKKYGAEYHPDVKLRDLPLINSDIKTRIRTAIEERILVAPHEYGLPLRKTLRGYWKLRVGDYRVVFKVEESLVRIFCICHRKKAYEIAHKRCSQTITRH